MRTYKTDVQFLEIKIMSLLSIYSHRKEIHGVCMHVTNFVWFYDLAISIPIFYASVLHVYRSLKATNNR
jgi:uncharacterized membrane protein